MEKISPMNGFLEFIREQGVVGLAVGFILGGAISKFVSSLVTNILNPLIGLALVKTATWTIGSASILYGEFIMAFIDFLVIALVIYAAVRILRLDRLDKKKS
jgi:large conductance mechanosensitive channel